MTTKASKDYSQGKIYKIEPTVEHDEGDIYIGSTTKKYLSQRMTLHRGGYRQWGLKNKKYMTVFILFEKYGMENCKIILLENVNASNFDEIFSREAYYIKSLQCVNKNIPLQTRKEYREANKEIIDEKKLEYRLKNRDYLNEKGKKYHEDNKIRINEKRRKYHAENSKIRQEKDKEYYENNKEIIKEKNKRYYHENKDRINKKRQEQRASKKHN